MPNQIVPDITPGATAGTDTVLGVKSGGDDSLVLLPYGADLAVLTAAAAAKLPLAGGTITGPLFIEEPTVDAHAATKLYVDTNTTDKLPLAGGTVTGALFVEEPTVDAHAATKLYVDTTASASGALLKVNDLSDLTDAPTARANLGLGTAAVLASTYFATAAQGATADAALQTVAVPADITATGTPSAGTWLNGAGGWSTPAGGGDMLASANLSDVFQRLHGTHKPGSWFGGDDGFDRLRDRGSGCYGRHGDTAWRSWYCCGAERRGVRYCGARHDGRHGTPNRCSPRRHHGNRHS